MFRLSDFIADDVAPIPQEMFFPEPMTAAEERRQKWAAQDARTKKVFDELDAHIRAREATIEASLKKGAESGDVEPYIKYWLEKAAQSRPYEIELYGLSGAIPAKSSKFPLPQISASQARDFELFVRKAKPLKNAMGLLKAALKSLTQGNAEFAIVLSIQAAVLAGRGSAAVPKLAARIVQAAIQTIEKAIELAKRSAPAAAVGMSDPEMWGLGTESRPMHVSAKSKFLEHDGDKALREGDLMNAFSKYFEAQSLLPWWGKSKLLNSKMDVIISIENEKEMADIFDLVKKGQL